MDTIFLLPVVVALVVWVVYANRTLDLIIKRLNDINRELGVHDNSIRGVRADVRESQQVRLKQ